MKDTLKAIAKGKLAASTIDELTPTMKEYMMALDPMLRREHICTSCGSYSEVLTDGECNTCLALMEAFS